MDKLAMILGRSLKLPRFSAQRMLITGNPTAVCDHSMGWLYNNDDQRLPALIRFIGHSLKQQSRNLRCPTIILRDIPRSLQPLLAGNLDINFDFYEALPNSYVPIGEELYPYPFSCFKAKAIKRYLLAKENFKQYGFSWTLEADFKRFIPQMMVLYNKVHERSDYKFEKLDERFFELLCANLPARSYVLFGWDQSGKMVCWDLLLEDDHHLVALYMGMDYETNAEVKLYFNSMFRLIEEAEERHKKWLVLGRTGYTAKAEAGAWFEPYCMGFHSRNPILSFLVRKFKNRLFPAFKHPGIHPFLKEEQHIITKRKQAARIEFMD